MEDELRHKRNQIGNMEGNLELSKEDLAVNEKRLKKIESRERQLNKNLDTTERELKKESKEKEKIEEKIEEVLKSILKLKKKIQKQQLEKLIEKEDLLAEIDKINQERLKAEALGDDNSQIDGIFQKKISEIEKKIATGKHEGEKETGRHEIENLKKELVNFIDDLKKHESRRDDLKEKISSLKKETDYIKMELEDLIEERKKINNDNFIIQQNIEREAKKIDEAKHELKNLKQEKKEEKGKNW